jgi:hypothetical protein
LQFTVRRYVDEWQYHLKKEKQPESNPIFFESNPIDCKWEPPSEGFVKINANAAFHEATQCNIPGFETRNREETVVCIAFMHKKIRGIFAHLNKTYESDWSFT